MGRPGNVVLEEPDQQNDDDDEREKSATDVHSGLLCAVDVDTTAPASGQLRGEGAATMRPAWRRGRVVRQRPAKPRTPVRFWSAPLLPRLPPRAAKGRVVGARRRRGRGPRASQG